MPFTISHAAAALPLQRLNKARLRFAALAIGSASPDFHYFFHFTAVDRFGHTPAGILLTCLPLSWLVLLLWDRYGRPGTQAMLPNGWHLPPQSIPTSIGWTTLAILLGAVSHVVWDGFTHDTDWGVQLLPVLETPVSLASWNTAVFKLLQHASTLLGLAVLGLVVLRWIRTQPNVALTELAVRAIPMAAFAGLAGVLNGIRFWDLGLRSFLVAVAVAGMFAVGAGVVLYGAFRSAR
jgi:hypothetical protein